MSYDLHKYIDDHHYINVTNMHGFNKLINNIILYNGRIMNTNRSSFDMIEFDSDQLLEKVNLISSETLYLNLIPTYTFKKIFFDT